MTDDFSLSRPAVVVCGYAKSGTTIVARVLGYQTGLGVQNEVRALWGVSRRVGAGSVGMRELVESQVWRDADSTMRSKPILKFPEACVLLEVFPDARHLLVVRNPLDTICALLERRHEFTTLKFGHDEVDEIARDWVHHVVSALQSSPSLVVLQYEEFVEDPMNTVRTAALHLSLSCPNDTPPAWLRLQAQPYFGLVAEGQPIRGPGRWRLSLTKTEAEAALRICAPAVEVLNTRGVRFAS